MKQPDEDLIKQPDQNEGRQDDGEEDEEGHGQHLADDLERHQELYSV